MQHYEVDRLNFDFPDTWLVCKYDNWSFYRNQFAKMWNGIKALDLLAVDPTGTVWLIEVKDYRVSPRTKPSDLGEEVAHKVFDTLAAILPAKLHANDADERNIALAVAACGGLRVVLHLEQPVKRSKLYPKAIDPAKVKQKIRQLLKPVDAHPNVVNKTNIEALAWSVN